MKKAGVIVLMVLLVGTVLLSWDSPVLAARIKDLAQLNGVRPNQLIGYGLVVGLEGTGDKMNTIFTNQSLANMLNKMGVNVDPKTIKVNNTAAVIVTADLLPFAKVGNKFDAVVASIGDAKSLLGGVLLLTTLKGADGEIYSMAQGPLVVGGFSAGGAGAQVTKNHLTVGRIVNGASVERELNYATAELDSVIISLKTPDFTTAGRIAEKVNDVFRGSAFARDGGTINIKIPKEEQSNPVKFISVVENLEVNPDKFSKIVVNERTGTVVIGENVRISTIAISHGNITVQIKEEPRVIQPLPFSQGQTAVVPETKMRVEEQKSKFMLMEGGISIRELVNALNAIGVSARDMISVLQAVKSAGALHADLEVL